jgi:hypothetical protein
MEDIQFEVIADGVRLKVTRHHINEQDIFRIEFPDQRKPLITTLASPEYKPFWTSIPQGRQKEATDIGLLIDEYLKK